SFTLMAQDCIFHPPSQLHVSDITACSAKFSWHSTGNVVKYIVTYKLSSSNQWEPQINVGTNTSYEFTGLLPTSNYDFAVRARCSDGSVSKRKVKKTTTLPCTLPNQVSVKPVNSHTVKITAQGPCSYDSLHVKYSTLTGPQTIISYAAADSYLVSGLNFDSTYKFQVSTCPLGMNSYTNVITVQL